MKLFILISLLASLTYAHTHHIGKVWVCPSFSLTNIKLIGSEGMVRVYQNDKPMSKSLYIVSCRKPEGYCLKRR